MLSPSSALTGLPIQEGAMEGSYLGLQILSAVTMVAGGFRFLSASLACS